MMTAAITGQDVCRAAVTVKTSASGTRWIGLMTRTRQLYLLLLATLSACVPPALTQAASSASTGTGSGWVAEFIWSPEYCSKHRDSGEVQCLQGHGFVLHEMRRVVDGRVAADCEDGAALSEAMLDQMAAFTRNRVQTLNTWRRHGRCSGLSETAYAAYAEYVDRRIIWPSAYAASAPEWQGSADELVAAVIADNPVLKPETVALQCRRRYLESINLCLDERFEWSATACPLPDNCGDSVRLRPGR